MGYKSLILYLSVMLLVPGFAMAQNNELTTSQISREVARSEQELLRDVVVTGYGKDVHEATQNAVKTALTQIVGSFIDVNISIEKRLQIDDEIKKQSKLINSSILEYSQGVVKKIEIIEVKQASLVTILARITVRDDSFKKYVKTISEDAVAIGPGIAAQMQVESANRRNLARILTSSVLAPIFRLDNLEVKILDYSPLTKYDLSSSRQTCGHSGIETTRVSQAFSKSVAQFLEKKDPAFVSVAKVQISLKSDYLSQINTTLGELSKTREEIVGRYQEPNWIIALKSPGLRSIYPTDNTLNIVNIQPSSQLELVRLGRENGLVYSAGFNIRNYLGCEKPSGTEALRAQSFQIQSSNLFSDLQESLKEEDSIIRRFGFRGLLTKSLDRGSIEFIFSDENNSTVGNFTLSSHDRRKYSIMIPEISESNNVFDYPWNLLEVFAGGIMLYPQRSFHVFFYMDDVEKIKKMKKIAVKIKQ